MDNGNPYVVQQQNQQQQQMPMINPMMPMQGGLNGLTGLGGGSTGASSAGSALASNPVGLIIAAGLAQNVAHNKGISSWQSALKGQSGGNIGSHFMDQWGVDESSPARDVSGVLGWDKSGGGIFNPNYLSRKIFGDVD